MFRVNSHRHLIGSFRISLFTVSHLFMLCGFALSNEQRVKLCADANCKGDLFPSSFIRAYDSGDLTFLKAKVNSPVKIVGFKFSERPDLLEAEDEEGKRGFIYASYIDQTPYVIFLESALKKNQTLYMVERVGEWPRLIKEVAAVPELTRMYKTYAEKLENYPLDKELLASLTESEPQKNAKTHRHNHQQSQLQLNSNAEQPNVRNVQKVDATQNNGQLGRTDDEKGNTPISGEKGNQPENLMGQSKEFVIQDQSKESEKQAEVVSNPERQQQIADDNEPTPPPVTNNEIPANKNDLKSTDQTQTTSNLPEVNTQNKAEVRNVPSEKNENSITDKKTTNPVQQRQQVQPSQSQKDPSQDNVQKLPLQHVNPPQSSQRADSPNPTNQETQSQHNIQPQQMAQPVNTNNKSDQNEQPAVEQPTNSNTNSPVGEQPTNSGTNSSVVEQPTNSGTNSPVGKQPTNSGTNNPAVEQPTNFNTNNPVGEQPTNSGTNSPVPTNTGTNSPVVEQPTNSGTNSPVPTNTGTNSPVVEQPTNSDTNSPVGEQPTNSGTVEQPTNSGTNSPVVEQLTNSGTNSPVPTNSGTNSPVGEQPTNSDTNSPVGEQPTNSGTVEQPTNTVEQPMNTGTNGPVPTNSGTNSPVPTNSGTNNPVGEQPTNSGTNTPVGEQPTNSGTVEQPTNSGTNSPVPTNSGTNSLVPTNSGTNSPVPTNSGTNNPVGEQPTNSGTNTPVGEQPTNSGTVEQPTNSGTNSPVPTNSGTNSLVPTNSGTNSPVPTNSGTNNPVGEQPTNSGTNTPVGEQPTNSGTVEQPTNSGTNTPAQSQQNLENTLVEENSLERPNSKSEETLSKDKANYQRQLDVDPLQQPREGSTTHNSDDVKTMQKSIANSTGTPTIDHPLPMQRSDSETTTSQEKEESAGKLKEDRGLEDATRNDYKVNRGDNELKKETAGGAEQSTNQAYCFKEDCQELDKQFSNSEQQHQQQPLSSSGASAPRRMFREWMAIGRNVLPEPLCHFEDTGLIVLAFVLLSAFVHLINCLLSSNSGPEPFDHRLLHDCITRLKEQELIIEKAKKNAAVNQHLAEAANAAEQLQKQNEALEQTLKTVEKRTLEFESENGKLKQLLKNTQYELEQSLALNTELKASVEMKDADLKKTESNQQRIESELSDVLSKLAQSRNREKYLEHDLNESHSQLERVKLELNEAQNEVLMKRNECAQKAAEIDELLGVVAELNKDNVDRRGKRRDNEEGKKKKQQSQKQNEDNSSSSAASSPGQPTPLLEAVELDPDNGAGSGGSAGWSDLGDGIEAPGAESESGGKLFDVLELAKLKSRLRSLEAERDQIKFALKVEHDEKENLLEEVARLRQDLVERKRDSEQRDLDRHGLTQQCTKLLQMMEEKVGESAKLMEEKEKKVERSEQEREKLRNRLSEVELGLLRVEDEKRELQHRIKELDHSLKQSNELNGQLENKHYHEERRLNTKIRQLDEQLANAKSSLSPLNVSGGGVSTDLNMSGNSSDREFVPVCSPDGGGARERSFVPSLWSEIDANEPVVEELVSRERKALASFRRRSIRSGDAAGEPNRESPFLADLVHVNKLGREERMNSSKYSSGASVRSSVAPRQRMRSRSAGRQSVARLTGIRPNLYGGTVEGSNRGTVDASFRASVVPYQNTSGKNSPYRQQERPQSSARLKNAVVGGLNVYSSDSNDAPSPPPEMPLLSGVPPPGLQKRPAVFVPAFKPNVQLHIPSTARK